MIVKAEITPEGLVKVKNPEQLPSRDVYLIMPNDADLAIDENESGLQKGTWSALSAVFEKIDATDLPRRSYEEIMKDLRELRER